MSAQLYPIHVVDDSHETNLGGSEPDYQWTRDSTSTSHNIRGIKLSKAGDLEVSFKPIIGQTYFLLYVLYSTGDSFGHDSGNIEFIGLYRTDEVAKRNAERIRKSREDYEKKCDVASFSVELETGAGKLYKTNTPWNGYFESLEDVVSVTVIN